MSYLPQLMLAGLSLAAGVFMMLIGRRLGRLLVPVKVAESVPRHEPL